MLQLKSKIVGQYQEWKGTFWISMALSLMAYIGYIVHFTYAVDDDGHFFSNVNHIAHGRWFADFVYNVLLQKSFMPALSPIISIICYVLTGIGICKLWTILQKTSLLTIATWSLHQIVVVVLSTPDIFSNSDGNLRNDLKSSF